VVTRDPRNMGEFSVWELYSVLGQIPSQGTLHITVLLDGFVKCHFTTAISKFHIATRM